MTVRGPWELSDPHRGCEEGDEGLERHHRAKGLPAPWHVWESLGGFEFDSLSLGPLEHILMGGRWVPWHLHSQEIPSCSRRLSVGATRLEVPHPSSALQGLRPA